MSREELFDQIQSKESFLCVGLDTDPDKIPSFLKSSEDPVYDFNRRIIDATVDHCVAYKPNIAFYEALGSAGWESLRKTIEYIPSQLFTIADAKRGDIGNTSEMYAKAFFDELGFDAITLSPYMGKDSISPYLERDGHWAVILGLTSNTGSADFQKLEMSSGGSLYEQVMITASKWGSADNTMFVVGATQAESLRAIRDLVPDHFLLVPGVGAQGGDLADVAAAGMNRMCGLLVNSSRSILYASDGEGFERDAKTAAQDLAGQMRELLAKYL